MMAMLGEYLVEEEVFETNSEQADDEEEQIDPRWSALKGLNADDDESDA